MKSKILGAAVLFLLAIVILLSWPSGSNGNPDEDEKTLPRCSSEKPEECEPVSVLTPTMVERKEELKPLLSIISDDSLLPEEVDRMTELFAPYPPNLPCVETLSYIPKVSWLTGRSAYLGDYASFHKTSKHFISRSLKGAGNYFSEAVSLNDRFNVLRTDHEIEFHLVIDLSRLKLWLYCFDHQVGEPLLLKTYQVGAGRLSQSSPSGSLTPIGTYALGQEVAVYKEGTFSMYHGHPTEMITVFGTRWIPFSQEIAHCTASCKGLGLHGMPWHKQAESGELIEDRSSVGKYLSHGCIRLLSEDISEIYAIVVSRPAFVHLVKDFFDAKLPGMGRIE